METFAKAERLAGIGKMGLWSDESSAVTPPEPFYNFAVYITRTGEKYHQTHCQYLLQNKIPVTLSEKAQTACSSRLLCMY